MGKTMNDKQNILLRIVDAVVSCCTFELPDGSFTVSRDDVLGKSHSENVVLTRQILCMQLRMAGYSVTSIAMLLNRSTTAVRKLIETGYNNDRNLLAFHIAYAQASIFCENIRNSHHI